MRRKKLILLAATLIVALVLTLIVTSSSRRSIPYHEKRLNFLRRPLSKALYKDAPSELNAKGRPVHLMDFLRFGTWRWYWRGAYTVTSLIEEQEKHKQALFQLGYYERREFTLTNRALDARFFTMITNGVNGESVWCHADSSRDRWIRITARKIDMPILERSLATFDSPNKR